MQNPICPHLRSAYDDSTPYAFPTEDNRCYAPKNPKPIANAHQQVFCLSVDHVQCPVFDNPQLAARVDRISTQESADLVRDEDVFDRDVELTGYLSFIEAIGISVFGFLALYFAYVVIGFFFFDV